MRFAGQGLVAQPKWEVNPVMDEIPRWLNPRTGKLEPIHKPEVPHGWPDKGGGPVHGNIFDKGPFIERPWERPNFERLPWDGTPGKFETMEIKPGWKPSPPQTMEIRY